MIPFMIAGLGLIVGSIMVHIFMQSPMVLAGVEALFGGLFVEQLTWMAANLEVLVPLGFFLLTFRSLGPYIAGGLSILMGLVMWGVLML